MICVASNNKESLDSVNHWKVEVEDIEPERPKVLILTKSDLLNEIKDKQQAAAKVE